MTTQTFADKTRMPIIKAVMIANLNMVPMPNLSFVISPTFINARFAINITLLT